jgi:hypothetical protein
MAEFLNGSLPLSDDHETVAQIAEVSRNELVRPRLLEVVTEWIRCGRRVMPEESVVSSASMGDPPDEFHVGLRGDNFLAPVRTSAEDPLATSWLWAAYWDFVNRNKPGVWPAWTGEVLLRYFSPSSDPQGRSYRLHARSPLDESKEIDLPDWLAYPKEKFSLDRDWLLWDEATHWFMLLLNSGHASRFRQCVNCKRFFLLRRSPRRGFQPKRGNYCGNCKASSSAERTAASRDARQLGLIEKAAVLAFRRERRARRFVVWTDIERNNLAVEINEGTASHQKPVKKQWVSRHLQEIQQRMEELRHAKS